ncbi:MAG: ATP-dependent DNA helicase RecG [Bacteroidaceae bacterium]|nr:ATP-dependent DNA helicase RecG [Bacteroidaceae bacterium]
MNLSTDIKYLQGVGPQRAELLTKEIGIKTMGDMLCYYPYRYVDRSKIYRIREIDGNMPYVQLYGQITAMEEIGEGHHKRIVGRFSDGTGWIELVWFQGLKFVSKAYKVGKTCLIFGKPTVFNNHLQINHPEIETMDSTDFPRIQGGEGLGMRSYYHTTERMKKHFLASAAIGKLMQNLFDLITETLPETLPESIIDEYHLMPYDTAIRQIHFPNTTDNLRRAQARLKFDELFYIQLNILRYAKKRRENTGGFIFNTVGEAFNTFYYNHLPFPLTAAQKRVVKEIRQDMRSGKQMNRLLQGDVGSGKTLVALLCSLITIDNGYQTVIMAPTEILAEQHLETIRNFLGDMPLRVELLTGSVKGKRRREILASLLDGTTHILVGTHAIIEDEVQFRNLGFAVIDEQHRFGVAQRAKLWKKTPSAPHILVMTATPIPRTLAMTLYGDLDVSVIDELPPGRKPIKTVHQFMAHLNHIYASMRRELRLSHQAYVVYPLIKETERLDLQDLEKGYADICDAFPEYKVSRVHGKLRPAEKDKEMEAFAKGETQILVATTVIEVGVNVPNASVMVIMNAERFGLSQLHQLRGRVGRGAEQSYCVLVTNYNISDTTRKRIQIMVDSTDGFEIAEADLKLRGPGDLEGTQQSGMAFDLKIANLARDGQILNYARAAALRLVDNDPEENLPQYQTAWKHLAALRETNTDWGAIS